jgi:hypothetical protein
MRGPHEMWLAGLHSFNAGAYFGLAQRPRMNFFTLLLFMSFGVVALTHHVG